VHVSRLVVHRVGYEPDAFEPDRAHLVSY
jgi:hypothetical protein